MEPQAYLQSAVDEVGSVFATRRRPEALPDLSDSLESREKPGQEGLQRYSAVHKILCLNDLRITELNLLRPFLNQK